MTSSGSSIEFKSYSNRADPLTHYQLDYQLGAANSSCSDFFTEKPMDPLIGNSSTWLQTRQLADRAAQSNTPVLLVGQRGTGKDRLATTIHRSSVRADQPCVKVRCGAVDRIELAKHFNTANGGSLLLDDIDQATTAVQLELLSRIEDVEAINGYSSNCPRIIATTTRTPHRLVPTSQLREDLFWLLSSITIHVPPLRDRREDIPEFVEHFLAATQATDKRDRNFKMGREATEALQNYGWPGNLRELQCFLRRAVVLSDDGQLDSLLISIIEEASRVTERLEENSQHQETAQPVSAVASVALDLNELSRQLVRRGIADADKAKALLHPFVVNAVEKELIAQVLDECEQVQTKAAVRLGINRNTLHKKVQDYKLDAKAKQ